MAFSPMHAILSAIMCCFDFKGRVKADKASAPWNDNEAATCLHSHCLNQNLAFFDGILPKAIGIAIHADAMQLLKHHLSFFVYTFYHEAGLQLQFGSI